MNKKIILTIVSLSALLGACAKTDYQQKLDDVSIKGLPKPEDGKRCIVEQVSYQSDLNTAQLFFKKNFDAEVSFGLNLLAIELGLGFKESQLELGLTLRDRQFPARILDSKLGNAKKKDRKGRIKFKFKGTGIGLDSLRQTPINELLTKALDEGIRKLNSTEREWVGRVRDIDEANLVYIHVGRRDGLNIGDQLKVFKTHYDWAEQQACAEGATVRSVRIEPTAILEAKAIGENLSIFQVTQKLGNSRIEVSDEVIMEKTQNKLKKLITIGKVSAGNLVFEEGKKQIEVNLDAYIRQVFGERLLAHGYQLID